MEKPSWCRMLSRRLTETFAVSTAEATGAPWRSSARATLQVGAALVVALAMVACGSAPTQPDSASPTATPSDAATTRPLADGATAGSPENSGAPNGTSGAAPGAGAVVPGAPPAPVPARALADFNRAVGLMKSGNAGEAELEF